MKIPVVFLFITFLLLPSCVSIKPFKEPPIEGGIQYGTASWYGGDFHGRPTASGVIYDMYGISAAHKTLPLGTIARVKNMKNEREVEVVINDRGPFVDGRIIDLSFGAAQEIDMVEDGVVPVRLEIIGREPSHAKIIEDIDSGEGDFVIQVGSFKDYSNADRLKMILEWEYDNVYIKEVTSTDSTIYYRVRIGPYSDHNEAIRPAQRLAEEGYTIWITRE